MSSCKSPSTPQKGSHQDSQPWVLTKILNLVGFRVLGFVGFLSEFFQ
jgi:hypothetical protein